MISYIAIFYTSFLYHAIKTPEYFGRLIISALLLQVFGTLAYLGGVCGRGESYAKDLGQRYSPVRLMCSHPNGETWASRSGSIWVPLAARVLTTSPSFMVFQNRSEEHTSELQSLMRISYAVFCLKKKNIQSKTRMYTINLTSTITKARSRTQG